MSRDGPASGQNTTYIYRVIYEERHSFRELICHVMLMKKVHMNMGPIFNSFGENDVYLQNLYETM